MLQGLKVTKTTVKQKNAHLKLSKAKDKFIIYRNDKFYASSTSFFVAYSVLRGIGR